MEVLLRVFATSLTAASRLVVVLGEDIVAVVGWSVDVLVEYDVRTWTCGEELFDGVGCKLQVRQVELWCNREEFGDQGSLVP